MRDIWRIAILAAMLAPAGAAQAQTPTVRPGIERPRPVLPPLMPFQIEQRRYPINDTGQTQQQCYGPSGNVLVGCTGQLALSANDRQDGMIGRDVTSPDNSDGRLGFSFTKLSAEGTPLPNDARRWACVRDNVTGLVWENKTDDGGIHDKDNRYKVNGWSNDVTPMIVATNAERLCGTADWRLPTWYELHGILDFGVTSGPTIDTAWFVTGPTVGGSGIIKYWSSTQSADVAGSGVYRYVVDFAHAWTLATSNIADLLYVRLVSGAPLPGANRFRISADGREVTDSVLGLIWRRCLEGMSWSGTTCTGTPTGFMHAPALAHAMTQPGWRLPNIKEVTSILDRGSASPAWNLTLFPGTPQLNSSSSSDYWLRRPTNSTSAPFDSNFIAMISVGRDRRDNSIPGRGVHHLRLVRDAPATGTERR